MKARRVVKGCAVVPLLGVLGIGALFGALWLEHRSKTTLPAPTGPFAVGRASSVWAGGPGTGRELAVWIWYPAAAGDLMRLRPTTCPLPCARRSSARAARRSASS
ncbi:MAG TPA: hypothetical protein VNJ70_15340 [Thermoanaerobaculia bacterium]|nr:hypothetical protein [Thermoanaerobaculia bacterium]